MRTTRRRLSTEMTISVYVIVNHFLREIMKDTGPDGPDLQVWTEKIGKQVGFPVTRGTLEKLILCAQIYSSGAMPGSAAEGDCSGMIDVECLGEELRSLGDRVSMIESYLSAPDERDCA